MVFTKKRSSRKIRGCMRILKYFSRILHKVSCIIIAIHFFPRFILFLSGFFIICFCHFHFESLFSSYFFHHTREEERNCFRKFYTAFGSDFLPSFIIFFCRGGWDVKFSWKRLENVWITMETQSLLNKLLAWEEVALWKYQFSNSPLLLHEKTWIH
jgi:hypothetical protein